jgi:prevent-host-death family protein
MRTYSVAETKNQLSELIDRALRGEDVVITRHGHPVVELRSIAPAASPVSAADLDWLLSQRVETRPTPRDAAQLLRVMRDEDDR